MPEKIESLQRLSELAQEKRAVFQKVRGPIMHPKPAAFVLNMNGSMILRFIEAGLYVYEKKEKTQ